MWDEFIESGNFRPELQPRLRELQKQSEPDFEKVDEMKRRPTAVCR